MARKFSAPKMIAVASCEQDLGRLARAIARAAAKDGARNGDANPGHDGAGPAEIPDDVFLLTVREATRRLSTSDDVVRQMLRDGRLKGIKVGGAWRIPQNALTDFLISRLERP